MRRPSSGASDATTAVPRGAVMEGATTGAPRSPRGAMASAPAADRSDGENEWRVGGFDVFPARASPLRRKRALSVRDVADALDAASPVPPGRGVHQTPADDGALGADAAADAAAPRTPLRRLFPGNAGLHRAAARERDARETRLAQHRAEDALFATGRAPGDHPGRLLVPPGGLTLALADAAFATPVPVDPTTTRRTLGVRGDDRPIAANDDVDASPHLRQPAAMTPPPSAPPPPPPASSGRETGVITVSPPAARSDSPAARMARRRHRKRLAAIVVHQWKWFAADALETLPGRMHFAWRTKRECARAWLATATNAKKRRRQLLTHRNHPVEEEEEASAKARESPRAGDASDARRAASAPPAEVSDDVFGAAPVGGDPSSSAEENAADDGNPYFLLDAFLRWEANATSSKRLRASVALADRHRAVVLARAIVPAWRDIVWRSRRDALLEVRAVSHAAKRRARVCLSFWRDAARVRRGRRLVRERVADELHNAYVVRVLDRLLTAWAALVTMARSRRALGYARAARRVANRRRMNAFVAWRGRVERKKERRMKRRADRAALVEEAEARRRRAALARHFAALRGWAARRRALEANVRSLVEVREARLRRDVFAAWTIGAKRSKTERLVEEELRVEREKIALADALRYAWAVKRLARRFRAWSEWAEAEALERAALETRAEGVRLRVVERRRRVAFEDWRAIAQTLRLDRLAYGAYQATLRGRVFRAYRALVRAIRFGGGGFSFCSGGDLRTAFERPSNGRALLRGAIRRWRRVARTRAELDALARVARGAFAGRTLRASFAVWAERALDRRDRREKRGVARAHRAERLCFLAFDRWAGGFVERARNASARADAMRTEAHRKILRLSYCAWVDTHRERLRRRSSLALAAAHHGAVVLQRSLETWLAVMDEARARRVAEDEAVSRAVRALRRPIRARIVRAWADEAVKSTIARLLANRADAWRVTRTRTISFEVWSKYVEGRRVKFERNRRADAWAMERRYRFGALAAWVNYLVARRRKRRATAEAEAFRWANATSAVISAWTSFRDRSKARRRRVERSLAFHRASLLREGCALWVENGEALRERRVDAATREVAERDRRALVKAGGFARRWRRVAAKRARERREGGSFLAAGGSLGSVSGGAGGEADDDDAPEANEKEKAAALHQNGEPLLEPLLSPPPTTLASSLGRAPRLRVGSDSRATPTRPASDAAGAEPEAAAGPEGTRDVTLEEALPPPRRSRPPPRRLADVDDPAPGAGERASDAKPRGASDRAPPKTLLRPREDDSGSGFSGGFLSGGGAFSSGASRLRRPPRPPPADPLGGGGPLTPERLREYETAIAEYEALRAEAARLRAEAAALADPPPEAEEEEEEEAGAAVARAARRRVLAAAAAHLRARRAELLPAVRAAAAALGEARSDLASVASAFEGGA